MNDAEMVAQLQAVVAEAIRMSVKDAILMSVEMTVAAAREIVGEGTLAGAQIRALWESHFTREQLVKRIAERLVEKEQQG